MLLPPIVTYVSVAYTASTEITITTTVLPTLIGMSSTPSASNTPTAILLESDTTCSTTTSPTALSTSFITSFTTSSDVGSIPISTTASSSTSTSTSSAIPASATMVTPAASSTPIALTAEASHSSIGLSGTIGLSTALGIFCAAIIAFFCYYRRKRKFHKEAMLIVPRLSKHINRRSTETGEETLRGSDSRSDSSQKDIKPGMSHPQSWPVVPAVSHGVPNRTYNTYPPRSSSLTPSSTRSREVLSPQMTEQRSLGNNLYGIRYNAGGILTMEHDVTQEERPESDESLPRWDEALERLNTIHAAAALRRELPPSPLTTVKRKTPNPEDRIQPYASTLLHPTHSDLGSVSELDISDNPGDRDIEQTRAAALAKLEGRFDRYTTQSLYSRMSDGTPFHRPEGSEGRPQWRDLETHWPD